MRIRIIVASCGSLALGACETFDPPNTPVIDYGVGSSQDYGREPVAYRRQASYSAYDPPVAYFPYARRTAIERVVAECEVIADRAGASRSAGRQTIGGAVIGAITGALGAVAAGDPGAAAVFGAIGALQGGVGGAWSGREGARDRRYQIIRECLAVRGVQSY